MCVPKASTTLRCELMSQKQFWLPNFKRVTTQGCTRALVFLPVLISIAIYEPICHRDPYLYPCWPACRRSQVPVPSSFPTDPTDWVPPCGVPPPSLCDTGNISGQTPSSLCRCPPCPAAVRRGNDGSEMGAAVSHSLLICGWKNKRNTEWDSERNKRNVWKYFRHDTTQEQLTCVCSSSTCR